MARPGGETGGDNTARCYVVHVVVAQEVDDDVVHTVSASIDGAVLRSVEEDVCLFVRGRHGSCVRRRKLKLEESKCSRRKLRNPRK